MRGIVDRREWSALPLTYDTPCNGQLLSPTNRDILNSKSETYLCWVQYPKTGLGGVVHQAH